jgi:hypothetical protein
MTDRELLELAAKAAGKKVHTRNQADRDACGAGDVGLWISEGQTCWNPLTDDGDAFRLLVTLHRLYGIPLEVIQHWLALSLLPSGNDHLAKTRREIVRCAAHLAVHDAKPIESFDEFSARLDSEARARGQQ